MHRSGTSAVTRVINLLGADISPDLMPPVAGNNDSGFWESTALMRIHDQLLTALGSNWDDPFLLPGGWIATSAAEEARTEIEKVLERDFPHGRAFVVKDPRLGRVLPLWLQLLDRRGVEPVIVIPFRNPLEVAYSLKRRDGLPVPKSMLLYARSTLETELASRGRKRLFVDYGDLLSNWRAFAKRLGDVVGPAIRAPRAKTVADIESFLTDDLYRQRATRDDFVREPQSSATAIEIYDRLKEAAKTGNDAALRRSFNHLERTTTDMMRVLRVLLVPPPGAAITSPVEQAPQTDAALEEAVADEVEADKDAAIGRAEPTEVIHHALNLMADARNDLARRLDEVSARVAGLEELRLSLATQLAAADANAAHAVNNISGLEAARAELARQLGEARAGAAELASVRETLQRELDEARVEIQKLQLGSQGAETKSELQASQIELLGKQLDQARGEMTEMLARRDAQEEKLEEARSRASELANQIARSETTRGNLTRQLGEARARATDLLAAKEALQRELDEARADGQRLEVAAREAEARREQQSLKIEMLERDLDKARGSDPGLIAERDALQRAVEEARSQAQSVEAKALEAGARVEQQAVQIEELVRQLEEARRQAAEPLAGRDAQQPELELARAEAASAANQIDGLKAALSELTFQLKESRAGTEASVASRDAAQLELEAVRVDSQSVAAQAQAAEERVAQLQSRFETLSNELEESRAAAAELRRSRAALERKVTLLTKELEKAREGATELVAGRNALQRQIEQTRSEAQTFEVRAQKADTQTQQQAWQIELLRKDLDEARTRAAELTAGRNLLQLQIEEAGWEPRPGDGYGHDANGAAMHGKPNGAAQAIGAEAPGSLAQESVPDFDPAYYAERYPDVAAAGMHLLTHYIQHGRSEGRRGRPIAAGVVSDGSRFDPTKETIILISHEASRTGAPILALNLAQHLCAKYNIITILLRDGALVENFEEISSQVVRISEADRHPAECRYIIDAISRERPIRYAIVNSIVSRDCVPALGAAAIPTVMLIHEFSSHARPLSAVRDALIWATDLVFSAEVAADSFRREHATLLKGGVHVLPQGPCQLPASTQQIDLDSDLRRLKTGMRPPGSENALVVLGVGFVHLRKGIDLFLTSAASALRLNPERQVRFVWIGHGYDPDWELNYSVYLAEQIARSGLQDRVVILDEVSDLEAAYAMADVFYLSSRLDPLPNVTIDAALRGLPIICFEGASGMAEVLGADAAASTTVVPHLDADAAARLILKLAGDKRLRKRIGNATRAVAEAAFDMDRYVREIDKIGETAVEAIRQRRADFETIIADPLFDAEFSRLARSLPLTREKAIELFLAYWTNAHSTLRPFPGFHTQIYAEHHPELFQSGINPLADYIRKGHPAGPWMNKVISAEEAGPAPSVTELRTAIQAHFHYPELIADFLTKLAANELRCDLLLSTNDEAKAELLRAATLDYARGRVEIRVFPNQGRDIAPLLTGFGEEIAKNYDVVGHLHSKRSLAVDGAMGETWREFLWQHLLGDRYPIADLILAQFAQDEQLGLIFAEDPHLCGWDENLAIAEDIGERAGLPTPLPKFFNFPIGTMFWARTKALVPLFELQLDFDDYPEEPLANDGTMLHALERLLPFAADKAGFTYATVHVPGITR